VVVGATQEERGFDTTGFATRPGFQWALTGLRSQDGTPIYQTNLAGPITTGLYGIPTVHVKNGSWNSDTATVIHGDWSKSIVGIRQDITVTTHNDGIISDEEGAIVFNAMQQDATVLRAVFRVAWARANPATRLGPNADQTGDNSPGSDAEPVKFPFAAVVPASGS
jgi:HK97 family phage major capsid protein